MVICSDLFFGFGGPIISKGGLFYLKIFIPPVKPGVYFAKATNNAEIH